MKNMKKRLISTLLTVCMLLAFLPGTASAAEMTGSCGDDLTWSYSNGTLTIQGRGPMSEFVDSSSRPWHDYCNKIHAVSISNGVTSISDGAFANCDGMISVTIPNSVTAIGESAFYGCGSLTDVTLPDSVTTINDKTFEMCTSLVSIAIPNGINSIGKRAFWNCTSLNSVVIPSGVTSIGNAAFYHCSSLSSVFIPESVVTIERGAFARCSSLNAIQVAGANSAYIANDGILFSADRKLLHTYPAGKKGTSYSIPTYVTSIEGDAFSGCSSLTSVIIPNNIVSIGYGTFYDCSSLSNIVIPNSVTSIDEYSFAHCSNLFSVNIPNSVTDIGAYAFYGCSSLTSVVIPNSVTSIASLEFWQCSGLTNVTIPDSVTTIEWGAFWGCSSLTNVYYSGSESQWKQISIDYSSDDLAFTTMGENGSNASFLNATIHYNSAGPSGESSEHIYDTTDPDANVPLETDRLNGVTDLASAVSAVQAQVQSMTSEQKSSPIGADLATLYAETAVSRAASKAVSGTDILINKAAVTELEAIAKQTSAAVESALVSGGVSTARYIGNTVTLTTAETGEISIRVDPDILTTEVDKVVVEAPTYAITLKVADFKEDLTKVLTITAQDVGSGFAPGSSNAKATVKVNLPNGKTSNSVTLSLPKASGDTTYQTVVNTSGTATSSKYNPATTAIDGKVNTSGSYTVQTNQADFTDIGNKSAEMQTAIRYLAARGIIGGTGGTNYSPDMSITRAQIAALVIRALGKVDEGAKPTFKDVTTNNWYYSTAAVSQKAGIINGYEDNTYRGDNQILKEQIVAVAARVLKNEMGYKEPSNTSSYLSKYSDSVAGWAQPEVALATRENIVVYRTDGTFSGSKGMTRGDAAIIIYRLFQRIW